MERTKRALKDCESVAELRAGLGERRRSSDRQAHGGITSLPSV
ncbi:MAG TPA: hypothetical protein VM580_17365 [Labilithrix sp.]|nr:hypothetical protein [Labilithrix sp.]